MVREISVQDGNWPMYRVCYGLARKRHLLLPTSDPSDDQDNDAEHYKPHHDAENNQPYGDRRLVRWRQCWVNPQKFQAVIIQAENIIDAAPRQTICKSRIYERQGLDQTNFSLVISSLSHGSPKQLVRLIMSVSN